MNHNGRLLRDGRRHAWTTVARLHFPGVDRTCVSGCADGNDSLGHYIHACSFLRPRIEAAATVPPAASAADRLRLAEPTRARIVALLAALAGFHTVRSARSRISRASLDALPLAAVRVVCFRLKGVPGPGGSVELTGDLLRPFPTALRT